MPRRPRPASASSSSSTTEPPQPADPLELGAVRAAVLEDTPAPAPEPPPAQLPPGPAAGQPRAEVHDARTEPIDDDEEIRATIDGIEAALKDLTEQDLADFIQLGFGLIADSKPPKPEWEISEPRARRLALWAKKVIDRHPDALQWLRQYFPELVLGLILGYEVWTRLRLTRKRMAAEKATSAPAKEAADAPADS